MTRPLMVLFLTLGLAWVAPTIASAETTRAKVDNHCRAKPATLVVPAGKTAHAFKVLRRLGGTKCKVGGAPDNEGWQLKQGGRVVYRWARFHGQAPQITGGALGSLKLGPGRYTLYADGGAGATVVLGYSL